MFIYKYEFLFVNVIIYVHLVIKWNDAERISFWFCCLCWSKRHQPKASGYIAQDPEAYSPWLTCKLQLSVDSMIDCVCIFSCNMQWLFYNVKVCFFPKFKLFIFPYFWIPVCTSIVHFPFHVWLFSLFVMRTWEDNDYEKHVTYVLMLIYVSVAVAQKIKSWLNRHKKELLKS